LSINGSRAIYLFLVREIRTPVINPGTGETELFQKQRYCPVSDHVLVPGVVTVAVGYDTIRYECIKLFSSKKKN